MGAKNEKRPRLLRRDRFFFPRDKLPPGRGFHRLA